MICIRKSTDIISWQNKITKRVKMFLKTIINSYKKNVLFEIKTGDSVICSEMNSSINVHLSNCCEYYPLNHWEELKGFYPIHLWRRKVLTLDNTSGQWIPCVIYRIGVCEICRPRYVLDGFIFRVLDT